MNQATSSPIRKLAAIMFTDIAGYTKAMSADEETALNTLRKKRAILRPLITDNNGTFVKEIGDGTLSYFPSAIDAATCAVKLQQATYEDADMNLRIGVHVGDIVFDDEDVFGDGVNVAARLESMAPVGGVCVSKSVFEELLNKKEFDGVPLGLQQLKGVGRLIDVFALKAKNLNHPDPKEYEEHKVEPHSGNEVPSVAVLPLKNKGKEEDAFYAYGITADLISDLSRAGKIRVVSMDDIATADVVNLSSKEAAKKLHVRYIVNGMLWKHEDMFQLSIEMDDTTNNTVIWSDRWQEQWEELTTIKDKLADSILKALDTTKGETGITEEIKTKTEAYEIYLKAKYKYDLRESREDLEIARGLYRKAIELDNSFISPRIEIGNSYRETGDYDQAMTFYLMVENLADQTNNRAGKAEALRAIGAVDIYHGEFDRANRRITESLTIEKQLGNSIGEAKSLSEKGAIYWCQGDYEKSLACNMKELQITNGMGDDSGIGRSYSNISWNYCAIGDYKNAMIYAERSFEKFQKLQHIHSQATILRLIGFIHQCNRNYDLALHHCNKCLKIISQVDDRWGVANAHLIMGETFYQTGDYANSNDQFLASLEIWQALKENKIYLYTLSWIALCDVKMGNVILAEEKVKKIESLVTTHQPFGQIDAVVIPWNLSQTYDLTGNRKKAEEYLQKAHNELIRTANQFTDQAKKKMYLQNIRENREVAEAWESVKK